MINNLLFVCTGNLCRSPMAATLFAARAAEHSRPPRVASAGIAAVVGQPPPEPVIALMARHGFDVSQHKARQLTGSVACEYDLLLVMESSQRRFIEHRWIALRGRVSRLGEWRDEDVPDPYGLSEEYYAECLAQIDACLADWAQRLLI